MNKTRAAVAIVSILISTATVAQRVSFPPAASAVSAPPVLLGAANLPFQPIGPSDLVRITVTDSPELSQTFRVDDQGKLNLPLLQAPIAAQGLMPDVLRDRLAAALRSQHLFVNPVVDVSVVEYRSRDVTISGQVKTPMTVQDLGNLRVLGALSQAGGLLPDAGLEVIVDSADGSVKRLSVRELFDGRHPELNIPVVAGAQIRVPQGEQVFVVGDVKKPGAFPFVSMGDTTVLQLLALSGGLDAYSRNKAYIYRVQAGKEDKQEIEVPLRRILDRKTADVKLAANDILYVPVNGKLKTGANVVNHITGIGNTAVSAAIWSSH
jgi:polysaccharide export outer membrane protein